MEIDYKRLNIRETPEEFMNSQVFGVEATQEQINASNRQPRLNRKDVLFGKMAREWHRTHPTRRIINDDRNLLGS